MSNKAKTPTKKVEESVVEVIEDTEIDYRGLVTDILKVAKEFKKDSKTSWSIYQLAKSFIVKSVKPVLHEGMLEILEKMEKDAEELLIVKQD